MVAATLTTAVRGGTLRITPFDAIGHQRSANPRAAADSGEQAQGMRQEDRLPLIDRIKRALDIGVDTDKFERTAIALLQSRYPSISPVEAGKDMGRDGDIYAVIADDPESRGRVLATTGDPLANLKRSHKSWQKHEGFRVDKIVIVCSKDITASARAKMDEYCQTQSPKLPLPEYFGRDWLVTELVRSAEWRQLLTGVTGRMDSLTPRPFTIDGQSTALVGRDQEIADIKSYVHRGDDVLLIGVPGVGKSRLLLEVGPDEGLVFAVPEAAQYLADDLLIVAPSCVVVDDAHLHQDFLRELIRLRRQEGLKFSVVASTWPDQAETTADELPGGRPVSLGLMSRGEIDAIVQTAGVTGVHARRLVLEQADGRPGWALQLCRALIDGDGERVVSGELLLDHVMRYLRLATDSAVSLDAIACIAALNGAAQRDLERISQLIAMPLASLIAAVHTVATRGVIELRGDRWGLSPAIRLPLVGRWFFGTQRSRSWTSLLDAFPETRQQLTDTLLSAAATSDDARREAAGWARALGHPLTWSESTIDQMELYALTSRSAGEFASKCAREILAAKRDPELSPWGSPHDPIGSAAARALFASLRTWFNKEAIHGLLDLAIDPSPPALSEKPLEELSKLTRYLDPDRGSLFEIRAALLNETVEWMRLDVSTRWDICAEIISYCFDPSIEGVWADPIGSGTITIANSVESPERLRELVTLWDQVDALIGSQSSRLPTNAVTHLIRLFGDWLRLAGGHANGAATPSSEQVAMAAGGAWRILRTLRPMLDARPGLALRVQRELDLAERWNLRPPADLAPIVLDEDLVLFVGRRDLESPIEDWLQRREHEGRILAQRIVALGPVVGTIRFMEIAAHVAEVGQHEPTRRMAHAVVDLTADPVAWIQPAIQYRSADILASALWGARHRGESVGITLVSAALHDAQLRSAVITACVESGGADELAIFVVADLKSSDSWQLDRLFATASADMVLLSLLQHPVADIRAAAALACDVGTGDGVPLPPDWWPAWEHAFLSASPTTVHGHQQWRLNEMLKALADSRPAVCADWYERRLREGERPIRTSVWMDGMETVPARLPQPERERLARVAATSGYPGYGLLPALLSNDAELAARLLSDGVLDGYRALDVLTGRLDSGVEILGPVLLAHGVPPDQIARRISSQRSWEGEESNAIKSDIAWLEQMKVRTPTLCHVADIAISALQRDLQSALAEESERARHGRP